MKDLKSYVIDDELCLRIKFKPYTVYRLDFVDSYTYKMVKVGVIE